ncbi:dTDP-4-dehydrorhamnose reductase [Tropicibacter naphthalenivorans]|uniref:dTDP-4-dehydrorhamnose reductase n=1 Tax=Tropicibacter naphthalenivorans TaxID=441103 RepID=A0A0P1GYH5_9RHOB|nr:dTDP-4-dehydrorhamnose reductase [Tropicibacter naphthalenivorans]CUH82381.1 dTDP-4-dehydrorhamnose reductase [Tropicibacter naphthalenivorans]SMD05472.1 dTDP-4-dehydrorhamnose reductase [Tropicibacter naphthalenivorans]
MKVLVFGKTGQVATELARRVPAGVEATFLPRAEADQTDPAACAQIVLDQRPDLVINAAAYTAVDKAEDDEATAQLVNGDTPAALARACADIGAPFLHVSTDYVFDGSGDAPWTVDAATGPLGAYGRTKLAGEDGIRAANGDHAILRTSWVFSAHGGNFVKTMLRLSQTRDKLTVVADQIGGPTEAGDIAQALWDMALAFGAGKGTTGTYHFAGAPDASWADFAREIFARAGRAVAVEDIPSSAYPTPAKRPGNSRMDCSDITRDYGIARPDWRDSLTRVLAELEGEDA